jgi:hypothetical protein
MNEAVPGNENQAVIPAEGNPMLWIPACAGMTMRAALPP